jgi:hypothetical protein
MIATIILIGHLTPQCDYVRSLYFDMYKFNPWIAERKTSPLSADSAGYSHRGCGCGVRMSQWRLWALAYSCKCYTSRIEEANDEVEGILSHFYWSGSRRHLHAHSILLLESGKPEVLIPWSELTCTVLAASKPEKDFQVGLC